ncbi:hypothetical protein [Mesorhizobium sp. ANAO-SY3R2]|uniref:hypothetical protein n=1 Tax=Mesorhizobium sp. ANAO-SY3R2 TaxID=3166644 RepID=UPI00367182B7
MLIKAGYLPPHCFVMISFDRSFGFAIVSNQPDPDATQDPALPSRRFKRKSMISRVKNVGPGMATTLKHSDSSSVTGRHPFETTELQLGPRRNERCEDWMGNGRLALSWLLRVGVATAILTGVGILAGSHDAMAAELSPESGMAPATRIILLLAAASFVATLCFRRVHGRGRPVLCRVAVHGTSRGNRGEDQVPAPPTGRSGGAGVSAGFGRLD